MSSRVFVAGVGVISAIGNNAAECFRALETCHAGMGDMTYLDSIHRNQIPVAEVKLSNQELASLTGLKPGISRTALLSMQAAREALTDAGLDGILSLRTGFVSANTVGGMDKSEQFFHAFHKDHKKGRLRDVVNHECGSVTELIADQLDIRSYVTTISTACSSSANSIFLRQNLSGIIFLMWWWPAELMHLQNLRLMASTRS